MRIGLIGWYGHSNAGDDRILYCLGRFFDGHDLVISTGLDDATRRMDELNRCDIVYLGGGGLVLRGVGRFADTIHRLRARFACLGISVEAVHRDNIAFIEALKTKSEFLLVRDTTSQEALGSGANVVVGPDLTFMYPFEPVELPGDSACGLNLRDWPYWHFEHGGWWDRRLRSLDARWSGLKRVYPLPRWDPARTVATIQTRFASLVPVPLYVGHEAANDRDELAKHFLDVPARFDPRAYGRCDFVVGMRLHSLIFACQSGVPFVSLSYQPKNVEFCKAIGLERLSSSLVRLGELRRALDHLTARAGEIRRHLLEMRATFNEQIVATMKRIARAP